MTTKVKGDNPAAGAQVRELAPEHCLGLTPAVQHEREPAPAAVLIGQLDTVVRGKRRHRGLLVVFRRDHPGQMARTCKPPSTGSSVPVTYEDSSQARNSAALAMSSAVPIAPVGLCAARSARTADSSWPADNSR